MYSNLKAILDDRDMSIRELARITGGRFESIRTLYNDDMERFPRKLLSEICEALDVEIGDILKHKR